MQEASLGIPDRNLEFRRHYSRASSLAAVQLPVLPVTHTSTDKVWVTNQGHQPLLVVYSLTICH